MRICSKCGQETDKGSYCEHCGSYQDNLLKKIIGKWKIILGSIVFLAIFLALWTGLNYYYFPKQTVDKYLANLQKENYITSYNYVCDLDGKLVNQKAFSAWQKYEREIKGPIRGYMLSPITYPPSEVRIYAKISRKRKDYYSSFGLINVGNYFWPEWKVVLPEETIEFKIKYEGAKLYVDGVETELSTGWGNSLPVKVFVGEHYYYFKAQNAESPIFRSKDKIISAYLKPDQKMQEAIIKKASFYGDVILKAYNNKNPQLLSDVLGKRSAKEMAGQIQNNQDKFPFMDEMDTPTIINMQMDTPTKIALNIGYPCYGDEIHSDGMRSRGSLILHIAPATYELIDGKWVFSFVDYE